MIVMVVSTCVKLIPTPDFVSSPRSYGYFFGCLPRPPENHIIDRFRILHNFSGLGCFTYSIVIGNQALNCLYGAGYMNTEAFFVAVVWRSFKDGYVHRKGELWLECFMQNLECGIARTWLDFCLDNHVFTLTYSGLLMISSREYNKEILFLDYPSLKNSAGLFDAYVVYVAKSLIVLTVSHNLRACVCAILVSQNLRHAFQELISLIQLMEIFPEMCIISGEDMDFRGLMDGFIRRKLHLISVVSYSCCCHGWIILKAILRLVIIQDRGSLICLS